MVTDGCWGWLEKAAERIVCMDQQIGISLFVQDNFPERRVECGAGVVAGHFRLLTKMQAVAAIPTAWTVFGFSMNFLKSTLNDRFYATAQDSLPGQVNVVPTKQIADMYGKCMQTVKEFARMLLLNAIRPYRVVLGGRQRKYRKFITAGAHVFER